MDLPTPASTAKMKKHFSQRVLHVLKKQ